MSNDTDKLGSLSTFKSLSETHHRWGFFILMKKDTYYFSHDYNAASDHKILYLRQQLGMEGYGIYWYLIEQLAQSGGKLPIKIIPVLAMQMQVTETKVAAVINSFELFFVCDTNFESNRLNRHLTERNSFSEFGKKGALTRWKIRGAIEGVNNPPNAKERKGKENIIKGLHLFKNSVIFDKAVFKQTFSGWSNEKLRYYYESANDYSESKGKMYKDWIAAIRSWERKDQIKGDVKYSQAKPTKHAGLI
jgi:hypothetical protein